MKIFNIFQADWMYKRGANVVGFGLSKDNKVYVLFNADDKFNEVMKEWCKRGKERKNK